GADAAVFADHAVRGLHGEDLIPEVAEFAGAHGLGVGLDGHGFLLLAADGVALGHFLGGMPHGHVHLREAAHQAGIGGDVEAAHGDAGHGLYASAEESLAGAEHDLPGGEVHRGHGRTTEAIDRGAAQGLGEAGAETGDAGDVHALFGLGVGAAHDHVLQLARV